MSCKSFLISIILTFSLNCFSQFSKTHYIPPLSKPNELTVGRQYLYISSPSLTPINVLIKEVGGAVFNATVSRDNPYEFNIVANSGQSRFVVEKSSVNTVLNNRGYIIEAEDIVYVSARIDSDDGFNTSGQPVSNQAGAMVSKGLAALGTQFRIGGFLNLDTNYGAIHYTFITVMATENNTQVSFADIKTGAILINDQASGNMPANVILNAGESYIIAVQGPTEANRDALIGSSVSSDKPVVVNCGSLGGTNSFQNLDYGFDQIVSVERTGQDYIFIKSTGQNYVENALIIANEDFTEVYLNDNTTSTPNYTLNKGEYVQIDGSQYNANGNLYVHTNEKVFAYQSVSNGNIDDRNQELFFVPPLSCQTPKSIDNIPLIENIGTRIFTGRITITTRANSTLNFIINGANYTISNLPASVVVNGPSAVTGNTDYECYTITGLTGNVSVFSTSELYLAAYGSESAATFGGYYSGFTFKPQIALQQIDINQSSYLPNVNLQVSSLSGFDTFQWYYNGNPIAGATTNSYQPDANSPGNYYVKASLSTCSIVGDLDSDIIPVSISPTDDDNDGVDDNVDLDLDNDGLANCLESFGIPNLDLSTTNFGTIAVNTYSNSFTGTTSTGGNQPPNPITFSGSSDGSFVSSVPSGDNNFVSYQIQFAQSLSISIDYPTISNANNLIDQSGDFVISVLPTQTITLQNPNNQLLVDTNYDGIYESNVTQFSSFEIRFRVNSAIPLAAGTGTFGFFIKNATVINYRHKNLVQSGNSSNATFKITTTCVSKDSDGDGIPDKSDYDSDNDGITDLREALGSNLLTVLNQDLDQNGIDDAFGNGIVPANSDNDSIPDYLDLDSDNDGIYDLIESGSNAIDATNDGIIDGLNFGTSGLANNLETIPNSGILNYTVVDTDNDGIENYFDYDSDGDNCTDVVEAGYTNVTGAFLGTSPPVVTNFGVIANAGNYITPNSDYLTFSEIIITTQPQNQFACLTLSATFTITTNQVDGYQWQISTNNGTSWTNIFNSTIYSGVNTNSLTVSNVTSAMIGHQFRVYLSKIANICGAFSNGASLDIYPIPTINSPINLVQCDDDTDGLSFVNLTQKNLDISLNAATDTFTYFTSFTAADTNDATFQIVDPTTFYTNDTTVWARVTNVNGCSVVAQVNVFVATTQIAPGTSWTINECDNYVDAVNNDTDGISIFDFTDVQNDIQTNILPLTGSYSIAYYKNETDFLLEENPILNITSYSNIGFPITQTIWVRVDNNFDNSCYGFGLINLVVNPLPNINLTDNFISCKNQPLVFIKLDAGINDGTPIVDYTYKWYKDGIRLVGENNYTLDVNASGIYTVDVITDFGCFRTKTITVVESDIATIDNIKVVDLVDVNSVNVIVTGSGIYEYSLDDEENFQDSEIFTDVSIGIHDLYIRDKNGCGIIKTVVYVLGAPKFFTPNGDGVNDTWNIKGTSRDFNDNAIIYIFDRFGKLIKQISSSSEGWDGMYEGAILTADDYWFTAKFNDNREAKGHFSLKR